MREARAAANRAKRQTVGEFASLAACLLESARQVAQEQFKKQLKTSREEVRPATQAAHNLRGYQNAGRPSAEDLVMSCMAEHHERNRGLYMANAQLLVRRAGVPAATMQAMQDPDAAAGLVRRQEARQLLRKYLLMQKLDPPIGAIWNAFEEAYGAVDVPEEYDYHVLSECTSVIRRAVWRDLTLLLDEMADEYEDMAEQVFAHVEPQNPAAPAEAQHVAVEAFVDSYISQGPHLLVRTSLSRAAGASGSRSRRTRAGGPAAGKGRTAAAVRQRTAPPAPASRIASSRWRQLTEDGHGGRNRYLQRGRTDAAENGSAETFGSDTAEFGKVDEATGARPSLRALPTF